MARIFRSANTDERGLAYTYLSPLLVLTVCFVLLPVVGTLLNSLYLDVSYRPRGFVGLENYRALLSNADFWQAVLFTLSFTVAAVSLELLFGLLFALLLNEAFPGRAAVRALVLVPWAVPTVISARIWESIYDYDYGLLNHLAVHLGLAADRTNWLGSPAGAFWGLVVADVWKTTPFVVILLLAALQAIPQDLCHQARVDGARSWKRLLRLTLPMIRPVLVIALIFRTIDSFRVFGLIYILTGGGPGGSTRSLSLLGFQYYGNDRFGMGSAISVITFALAFLATLLYLRAGRYRENLS